MNYIFNECTNCFVESYYYLRNFLQHLAIQWIFLYSTQNYIHSDEEFIKESLNIRKHIGHILLINKYLI